MTLLLGIDIGTTTCKVALFDENATILDVSKKEYKLHAPKEGLAEIDPVEMWDNVKFCIKKITKGLSGKISAIAISSHGEGVIPIDENGIPLGMEIVSFDNRSIKETDQLSEKFGAKYFFDKSGQILSSTGTISKIMWMKSHENFTTKTPFAFACAGDYILTRLCGKRLIDYSLASRTMMFDVHEKHWNYELLDFIGVSENQLSKPVQSGTIAGKIKKSIANELGLHEDTNLVVGGHDQPCALIGVGSISTNYAVYSLGTTETLICSMNSFVESLYDYGLSCYPHVLSDMFITLPGNYTGGNLLKWYKDTFGQFEQIKADKESRDVYDVLIDEMSEDISEILVLPHFTATGSPWNDAQSAGMISGLKLSTTKGEYIKALNEGVTFEILLNLKLLEKLEINIETLVAVGGGVKSKKLMQLKSDLLGTPIYTISNIEAACKGAAYLAGYGIGIINMDSEKWNKNNNYDFILTPSSEKHKIYLQKYENYQKMYNAQKVITK